MYYFEVSINTDKAEMSPDDQIYRFGWFISALIASGQALGRGEVCYWSGTKLVWVALSLEKNSLAKKNESIYARRDRHKLEKICKEKIEIILLGTTSDSPVCQCVRPGGVLMKLEYRDQSPSLRCLDCGGWIPLYRIPLPFTGNPEHPHCSDDDYYSIIQWERAYKACGSLEWVSCVQPWAQKQISDHQSPLSKQGRKLAARLESHWRIPVYYNLFNDRHITREKDKQRKCPQCGDDWLTDGSSPVENVDFKCDHCRLVSNFTTNT